MSPVANVAAVDAAVIALLAGDAELLALVPDGVYRDVAPAGMTRVVTVQLQTHVTVEGFQMPIYEEFRYRIVAHVLETSAVPGDAAAYRIHALLHDQVLAPIAGYTHMQTLRVEPIRVTDPDVMDNDLRWQLAGGDYEIHVSPGDPAPPAVSYADLVIADGASHHWRLGEPSGTITVDAVGTAHGTISGGVTLNQPGAIGDGNTAMTFNGSTGKVTLPTVTVASPASIETWVRATSVAYHTSFSNGAGGNAVSVGVGSGALYAFGGAFVVGVRVVNDGAWHHAVYVLTGTEILLYVDGTPDVTTSFPRTSHAAIATIGCEGASNFWLGSLDEIAIYPHALTPAQIAAHYAAAFT